MVPVSDVDKGGSALQPAIAAHTAAKQTGRTGSLVDLIVPFNRLRCVLGRVFSGAFIVFV
jgi:hypothetical protein